MKRQYSQKETETLLKSMTVVVDTREQVWSHIESGMKLLKYPCLLYTSDAADE